MESKRQPMLHYTRPKLQRLAAHSQQRRNPRRLERMHTHILKYQKPSPIPLTCLTCYADDEPQRSTKPPHAASPHGRARDRSCTPKHTCSKRQPHSHRPATAKPDELRAAPRRKRESDADASEAPARSMARDKTKTLTTVRTRTDSPLRSVDGVMDRLCPCVRDLIRGRP